jgi:hypothetical protein
MGPDRSPMAQYPVMGRPLWATLIKIKIKVKIEGASHRFSFCVIFNTYPVELSREI